MENSPFDITHTIIITHNMKSKIKQEMTYEPAYKTRLTITKKCRCYCIIIVCAVNYYNMMHVSLELTQSLPEHSNWYHHLH